MARMATAEPTIIAAQGGRTMTLPQCIACEGSGKSSDGGRCHPCQGSGIGIPWVSASQISTYELCPRKWFYRTIAHAPYERTEAAVLGGTVHKHLQVYARGVPLPNDKAGRIAIKALPWIPKSLQSCLTEVEGHSIRNGFGYFGIGDLLEPSTQTLSDYKTSKNPKRYGLSKRKLKSDTAAIIYSHIFTKIMQWDYINLRWIYLPTKEGASYPVDARLDSNEIAEGIARIDERAQPILMARQSGLKINDLNGKRKACNAYGGCPFLGICDIPRASFSASTAIKGNQKMGIDPAILNQIAAAAGKAVAPAPVAPAPPTTQQDMQTQLAQLQQQQAQQQAQADTNANDAVAQVMAQLQGAQPTTPAPAPVAPPEPAAANDALAQVMAQLQGAPATPAAPAPDSAGDALNAKIAEMRAQAAQAAPQPTAEPTAQNTAPNDGSWRPDSIQVTKYAYSLWINCHPGPGYNIVNACDLIAKANEVVCKAHGVSHYKCIDYGKGYGFLSKEISTLLQDCNTTDTAILAREDEAIDCMRWHAHAIYSALR
jgi:hypothetical protein